MQDAAQQRAWGRRRAEQSRVEQLAGSYDNDIRCDLHFCLASLLHRSLATRLSSLVLGSFLSIRCTYQLASSAGIVGLGAVRCTRQTPHRVALVGMVLRHVS